MKGEPLFSVSPKEMKNVMHLGSTSKGGDGSITVFSLKLKALYTIIQYSVISARNS